MMQLESPGLGAVPWGGTIKDWYRWATGATSSQSGASATSSQSDVLLTAQGVPVPLDIPLYGEGMPPVPGSVSITAPVPVTPPSPTHAGLFDVLSSANPLILILLGVLVYYGLKGGRENR